jgi:hypothetical protein
MSEAGEKKISEMTAVAAVKRNLVIPVLDPDAESAADKNKTVTVGEVSDSALLFVKKTFSSHDLRLMDSSDPIEVIPQPEAGKIIQLVSVDMLADISSAFGSSDFALKYETASNDCYVHKNCLGVAKTTFSKMQDQAPGTGNDIQYIVPEKKVVAYVDSQSMIGAGSVTVYVCYRINDL